MYKIRAPETATFNPLQQKLCLVLVKYTTSDEQETKERL